MDLFPLFLKLTGRPCLVIGAGNLAESKIESLLTAHGKVTVIAPHATAKILDLAASGEIEFINRPYAAGDVANYFSSSPATNVAAVNRAVFQEATASNVLCNAVDDPPFCDFYFPSVVRRGDLQIAISTAGASPHSPNASAKRSTPASSRHRRLAHRPRQPPPRGRSRRAPQRIPPPHPPPARLPRGLRLRRLPLPRPRPRAR